MVTPQQVDRLRALGKELNDSPLQSSDRACSVTLADGSMRLGITQVVTHTHTRSPMQGALFFRVSFRFVGDESDPLTSFHPKHDTVWAVVDRREGLILFGPSEGMYIRSRGLGIGTYLLGQLIRLLGNADLGNSYGVVDIALPVQAADEIDSLDQELNQQRAEIMLARLGFYVSKASGKKVAGARRFSDLKNVWSNERVRFLNIVQLMEFAAYQLTEAQSSKRALDLAASELELAHQNAATQKSAMDDMVLKLKTELDEERSRRIEVQSNSTKDSVAVVSADDPDAVLDSTSRLVDSDVDVPNMATESKLITVDFGKSLTRLSWGAMGLAALLAICMLKF